MKKTLLLSLFLVFTALLSLNLHAQPRKKKVVFIIADGIPADMLEKTPKPAIDLVAKGGGYKRAFVGGEKGSYSETPTISAVGYNSLLTGTWVNKHNVWDNDIKAPNFHYPTIFRLVKQADHTRTTAIFSTWLDNRTKLVGDSLPGTGNIGVDYHADGFEQDTVNFPHDKESGYIHKIDQKVTEEAEKCIRENAPDLTWLYLEYTDDMGHRYGDSPQMKEGIGWLDQQVGKIWSAIQYRREHFAEDWLVVITTDHGRDSISGKNHGGQSARERTTWIVTNAKGLNKYYENFQPAIVDILPTIARYMNITLPRENLMEMDGIPLIGKVSIADPVVNYADNKLDIHWKAIEKEGTVKIWLTTTNNFKDGGLDKYKLLAEIPVQGQSAILGVSSSPSSFYKIVLEAPYNTLNRWITMK